MSSYSPKTVTVRQHLKGNAICSTYRTNISFTSFCIIALTKGHKARM